MNGTINIPDLTYPNHFVLEFPLSWFGVFSYTKQVKFDIWATDAIGGIGSYVLAYSCENHWFGLWHSDMAWVLSRSQQLSNSTIDLLKSNLNLGGVDTTYIENVVQNC